ncbi:AmmeMemoRadiSam system protein A [Thalassotalea psychrophila]|uniref:AmmeMemoRadiSam system protein A n=1 Tax=Thalassotalea psychrophila TaxID=3065647 RepID=A0ABY9TPL2_9GAMM|nr:AmmeMemoRadiSam system protein A [Colwelliaceae bacterium SQ149]
MPALSCIELTNAEQDLAINLVRQVLTQAVKENCYIKPLAPNSKALLTPCACFVTLYVQGELRGCIGTMQSERPLWENICKYSYSSAFEDYRFEHLTADELENLSFQISILSTLEPMENKGEAHLLAELKPNVDGLVLEYNQHNALFLPSVWESLPKPYDFVGKLKLKAGLAEDYWHEDIKLQRFQSFKIESEKATN